MATITTAFNNPTVSRSRVNRSSAGVVAGYIRELASAPAQAGARVDGIAASVRAAEPATASAAADAIGAGAHISAARGRSTDAVRRGGRLGRGERGGCSMRAKRMLESL